MSSVEMWNLDVTLAKILAEKLREFADTSMGYPGNYTEESWKQKIHSIVVRLERYQERINMPSLEMEDVVVRAGQDAIRELADIFPALWD